MSLTGSCIDNYADNNVGSLMSDLDLRHGYFVVSDAVSNAYWSGSNSEAVTDTGFVLPDPAASSSTYTALRTDKLHIVSDGALQSTDLGGAEGDPPIAYTISETNNLTSHPLRITPYDSGRWLLQLVGGCGGRVSYNSLSQYFDYAFPVKSSCWAQGIIRGHGGSLAIDYTSSNLNCLFSMMGTDFDWERDNTLDWEDMLDSQTPTTDWGVAQVNRFPLCQQAVYYYNETTGAALSVTGALWAANGYTYSGTAVYNYKDTGVSEWNPDTDSVGVVGLVEFVDSEETL
jgi:hypothetical protein